MVRSRLTLIASIASLLLPRPAAAEGHAEPRPPRKLSIVPFYAPEQLWRLYSPLVEFLRQETGEPWELALQPGHEALVDAFCAGGIDLAVLGPVPLARVNRRCGGVPFLVALGAEGDATYRSVLLTADPAVTSVAGLRAKEVGFFRGSTAAHVVPARMLADAGLEPDAYRPVWLESQDRLVAALLAGRISAAGVKSALYERVKDEAGLRLLGTSGPLPNFSVVASPSLPPAARERIAAALLRLRPAQRAADAERVRSWDDELRHGFVRATPEHLAAARALQELAEGHGP